MIALIGIGLASCHSDQEANSPPGTFGKESSYAFGMYIGSDLVAGNINLDIDEFIQGMRDALTDSSTRYSLEEAQMIVQQAFFELSELQEDSLRQRDESLREEEIQFLEENSRNPGINITPSGLQYEVIIEGHGSRPAFTDTVRVHYEGTFTDGMVFDSSFMRGEPTEFSLDEVITGWSEGLQLMNVGGTYRFIIPSDLAYGPRGVDQFIPPYSTLIFRVELLEILPNG